MPLTARQLNRATLARQLLLRRKRLGVVEAIDRVVALQAQEPASPYVALWNRVEGFDPADLDRAYATHTIIKSPSMRITLHAVTAADYPRFHGAMQPSLRASRLGDDRFAVAGLSRQQADDVIPELLAYASEPRSNQDMDAWLDARFGDLPKPGVWWAIRTYGPFIHAPNGGPWMFGPRPGYLASPYLERSGDPERDLEHLVRRYLEGFGPATVADIGQFALVTRSRVKSAVEAMGDALVRVDGPGGTVLLDVPGGVGPGAQPRGEPEILAIVDGHLDQGRPIHRERVAQAAGELRGGGGPGRRDPERPRERHEVGVAELHAERPAELVALLPVDEAVAVVAPDHDGDLRPEADRGLELLDVHQQAAVPAQRHDAPVRVDERRRDRARQRNAHRRESVRDDHRVGLVRLVQPRDPDLVGADVGHHDVVGREHPAELEDGLLGLDDRIVVVLGGPEVGEQPVAEVGMDQDLARRVALLGAAARDALGLHGGKQAAQRAVDVPDQLDLRPVRRVHLRRLGVDVHDALGPVRVPASRRVLDQVVADADHDVGAVEPGQHVVAGLEPDGHQRQVRSVVDGTLAHERGGNRHVEPAGEGAQLARGAAAQDPVAGQDQRPGGTGDQASGVGDRLVGGLGEIGTRRLERRDGRVDARGRDVLRQLDVGGAGLLQPGDAKGASDGLGDGVAAPDTRGPLGHGLEHPGDVDQLVRLLVQLVRAGLARDRHHRGAVQVGIRDAGDEVRRARPQGRHRDGGPAGETAMDVSHERGALLVAGRDVAQARVVGERLEDVHGLLPGHGE